MLEFYLRAFCAIIYSGRGGYIPVMKVNAGNALLLTKFRKTKGNEYTRIWDF